MDEAVVKQAFEEWYNSEACPLDDTIWAHVIGRATWIAAVEWATGESVTKPVGTAQPEKSVTVTPDG